MSSALRDRIQTEYTTILDNASNLVKSFAVTDDQDDATKAQIPGEVPEIFAQKIVLACQNLLEINHHLKRNAILNDFVGRNAKVLAEKRALMAQAACLEAAAATGQGVEACEIARGDRDAAPGPDGGGPAGTASGAFGDVPGAADARASAPADGAGEPALAAVSMAAASGASAPAPPPLDDLSQDATDDLFASLPEATEFVDMSEEEEEL